MPMYEYKCEECGLTFERSQHFSEEPLKTCPECGGPVHRVIYPVGIIFKGKGFYVTDHRSGGSALTAKARSESDPKPKDKGTADARTKQDSSSETSESSDKADD